MNNQQYNAGYSQVNYANTYSQGQPQGQAANHYQNEQDFRNFEYQTEVSAGPSPAGDSYATPGHQMSSYSGQIFTPHMEPAGEMNAVGGTPTSGEFPPTDPDNEPPLMEELGINFDHIYKKTLVVLNPWKHVDPDILQDTDLAGPLVFCIALGACLLLVGKIQFGFIYGLGLLGCLSMYALLNLMTSSETYDVGVLCVISVLGYCLLPIVFLALWAVCISLNGAIGVVLSVLSVVWCAISASKLFVQSLNMNDQRLLVAYPCAIIYSVFALLTVF